MTIAPKIDFATATALERRAIEAAATAFGVTHKQLLKKDVKIESAAAARWCAALLLREAGFTLDAIAAVFEHKGHDVVMRGIKQLLSREDFLPRVNAARAWMQAPA